MKKFKSRKSGIKLYDKDIQLIGNTITDLIKKNNGELKPRELVNFAKPKNSPLHKFFEWDNTIAGQKWREHQAKHLIADVYEVIPSKTGPKEIRSFFNVRNAKQENVYVTLDTTLKTPNYIIQLITDIQHDMTHLLEILDLLKEKLR